MQSNSISNNKRIAKNTLLLYIRMFIVLAVSLYTVRMVFKTLGVIDYGIYNVVAGFVTSFVFLSNTTSSAVQRFLSFSIGKQDIISYDKYFKNCFILFLCLALISFLLLETFGMWFMYEKMIIPSERFDAAVWVFQSAVISLLFSFLVIPYNAVILSYERMDLFAWISIGDVVTKLIIVYLLLIIPYDHLKVYSVLYTIISITNFLFSKMVARKIHSGLDVSLQCDRYYINEILGFTGWNFFGSISGLARGQGLNVLINLFFGPSYNTARGIAYQVYNAINGFATNFMTAVNPQIIKLYASNQTCELEKLVYRSSKLSFTLLTIIAYPLFVLLPYILELWLGDVPPTTILFTRLVLANMLVECISMPLLTLAQATGKLKLYQSLVGGLLITNLPVSWIAFKFFNADAYICFVILITINIIALFVRLLVLRITANLRISSFVINVISRWVLLMLVCFSGYELFKNLEFMELFITTIAMTVIIIPLFSLFIVLNPQERKIVVLLAKEKILKK